MYVCIINITLLTQGRPQFEGKIKSDKNCLFIIKV